MQKLIFPESIPNGGNVNFPQFAGRVIGGQVLISIAQPLEGSPKLLGTFYPSGGFAYVRMVKMSLNGATFSTTQQLAIFTENPDYLVDGSFPLALNVTQDANTNTAFWVVASNPGKQTFLVVEV